MLDENFEWVLDHKKLREDKITEIHPLIGANYDLATQGLVNYDEIKSAIQLGSPLATNFHLPELEVGCPISNPVDNFITNTVHDHSNVFGKENRITDSALTLEGSANILGLGAQIQDFQLNNDLINLLAPPVFCENLQNNFQSIIPINGISADHENIISSDPELWLPLDEKEQCLRLIDDIRKLREWYSSPIPLIALIVFAYLVLESFSLFSPKFGGNRDLPIINH